IKDKEIKNKDKELEQESKARREAEQDKVKAEQDKVKAEQDKVKAEQDKVKAEQDKEKEKIAREKAERKALNVQKFMNRITVREHKLEWIYIGTTRLYAQERLFKIGSTTRLTSRIPQYNTGRPGSSDPFYYAWAIKCYNAKDVDFYIQKLLFDFKFKDPQKASEEQVKDNRAEMYHGIKFSDLKDILTFIVNNYDQSIEYINNFIKIRLSQSLEEEDEIPPALDLKKITYQIGDYEEVIDLEKENETELKKELKNIMRCYKEQQTRDDVIVVKRQDLVAKLNQFTNESKTGLWNRIKELTGWKASKVELEQSDSEGEDGSFKYKIKYN
ncbi:MAG: GIY-YIG nuclease family protein, partial [Cetobacterium sp.]